MDINYYHHFPPFVSDITFEVTCVVFSSDAFLSRWGAFEQPLCWLFDLSFLSGVDSSPTAPALPLFLSAPAVSHHFKWRGVFN